MTMTAQPGYSGPELRAAARALAAGHFAYARRQESDSPSDGGGRWTPGGRLIRVTAGHAGAGASTLALALAEAAAAADATGDTSAGSVRLLDGAAPAWSGLCGAPDVELGVEGGWRRGRRGAHLVIDRVSAATVGPAQVPIPRPCPDTALTVLDTGWIPRELAAYPDCWLATVQPTVHVVVVRASETAMGQAELVASTTDPERTLLVVVGGATRRTQALLSAAGPVIWQLGLADAVAFCPLLPARVLRGLGPEPLPRPLLAAATRLLDRITVTAGPHAAGAP